MKVYHVTRRFNCEKWGGTESVVWNLANQMHRKSVESEILSTSMFSQPGDDSLVEIPLKRFPYTMPFWGLSAEQKKQLELKGGNPVCLGLYRYLMKNRDADIIHTHVTHRLGALARTAALKMKIPYIVTLHGGFYTLPEADAEVMQAPFKGKFEWGKLIGFWYGSRKVLKDADAIICVGENEFEAVKKVFPAKHVIYQPNGVDISKFRDVNDSGEFLKRISLQENEKLIVCVSRIDPQKNQILLLEAFANFNKKYPEARLCFLGSVSHVEYHKKLESRVSELGLEDKVNIITDCSYNGPMLPEAYKNADVVVLPSRHEPFGIVVLEAWAAGVPVIASAVGGVPGFTADRKNVLHFESGNKGQLLECLNTIFSDGKLCSDLVSNANEKVLKYDWDVIASEQYELYKSVINRKKNRR